MFLPLSNIQTFAFSLCFLHWGEFKSAVQSGLDGKNKERTQSLVGRKRGWICEDVEEGINMNKTNSYEIIKELAKNKIQLIFSIQHSFFYQINGNMKILNAQIHHWYESLGCISYEPWVKFEITLFHSLFWLNRNY